MLGAVNGILVVKNEQSDQPGKTVKLMRSLDNEDFVKIVGIQLDEIPARLSLDRLEPFELGFLPADFFSHISEEQLVELIQGISYEKLLNIIAPFPRRCRKLFERFGNVKLHPNPELYPVLDSRIFKYFDPWNTIINGALTQEQYISLIHYNPAGVDEVLKAQQIDILSHSLTLLHRNDLDFTEVAQAIGSNANALQEADSILPEATSQRLNLLVTGYHEYVGTQKRQGL